MCMNDISLSRTDFPLWSPIFEMEKDGLSIFCFGMTSFLCKEWILTCDGCWSICATADSVSSFEVNSSFEKTTPASPFRLMASPRRTSHSPRVVMSPIHRQTRPTAMNLNYNQVLEATRNFSPSMKIGRGAFGIVYRGQIEDGQVVAIKRARRVS